MPEMGFENPIVGGTALRIPAIQSPNFKAGSDGWIIRNDGSAEFNNIIVRASSQSDNFVHDVSGWQLLRTGSAEFNDVTIRGDAESDNFVSGSAGWQLQRTGSAEFNDVTIRGGTTIGNTLLAYSSTPAAGNLILSISADAGTDAFGNDYLAGMSVYDPVHEAFSQLDGGIQLFGSMSSAGVPDTANAAEFLTIHGEGTFLIISPGDPAGSAPNRARIELDAGTANTTPGGDGPALRVWDGAQSSVVTLYVSGAVVKAGLNGQGLTWQTPSFNTGWSGSTSFGNLSGGIQSLQYRMDAEDNVWLIGAFTAASGAGAAVFQLPAGYRPAANSALPVAFISSGGTPGNAWMYVSEAGNLNLNSQFGSAATTGTTYYVNARFPLGNLS